VKINWILTVLGVGCCLLAPIAVGADDSCGKPGNLTYNCNFSDFPGSSPDGWVPWVTMGSPAFDRDDHGSAPGAPAQRIWSDGGAWTAGLYQHVVVTPGKGYVARIDWAAPNAADIERRIGIDPYGGKDPMSPKVVWSASAWAVERMPDLHVSAYAEASSVTVYVFTHHPVSHGADQVFLDAVTLVEDPNLPLRPTATPTARPTEPRPTRKPATKTPTPIPTPVPLTDTPTAMPASPTPTVEPTSTPTPTHTPSPSPTPTWTLTPTPVTPTVTPPPSRTPLPTIVAVAMKVPTVEGGQEGAEGGGAGQETTSGSAFLYVALAALMVGLLVAGVAVWQWSRNRRTSEEV
jgi:hypothetical protein